MKSILLSILFLPSLIWGQSNPLHQGIFAYEQQDYPEAIRSLAALIEAKGSVPLIQLPKAHFYLAQAYWEVSQDGSMAADYPEALLRAYNHLTAAKRLDKTGRYVEMSRATIVLLLPALYAAGTQAYNQQQYRKAVRYFDRTYQLQPSRYDALLARGFAQWQLQDSVSALNSWQKAIDNSPVKQQAGKEASGMAQAYAMIVHSRSSWGQVSTARALLNDAFKRYPNHPLLIEAELDLYLCHPELRQNGNRHFTDQLKRHKGNIDWERAYARFLYYSGDTLNAITRFERIQRLEPKNDMANRFLASYYVSEAKRQLDMLPDLKGEQRNKQEESILKNLLEALPYLSLLHQEDPNRIEWLEHLIAIADYLQLPQAKEYRKELRKLR